MPKNYAANSLNEETQLRNIRKVQVNAQVTFAIYVLETLALALCFVLWFLLRKNEISMTLVVILFYVLLPYTFLMNTDYNKNLITEYGFLNTIRNVLRLPCYTDDTNKSENTPSPNTKKDENQKDIEVTNSLPISKARVKEMRRSFQDNLNPSSVTVLEKYVSLRAEKSVQCTPWNDLNVPSVSHDPCSSNLIRGVANQDRSSMLEEPNTSIAEEKICTSPVNRRLDFAEIILKGMVANVLNEKTYNHYLRELVRLEKANDKKGDELETFEIASLDKFQLQKSGNTITSDRKLKAEDDQNPLKLSDLPEKGDFVCSNAININSLGRFLDRLELRKDVLSKIQISCMTEESYEKTYKALLKIEHGLVV